MFLFYHFLAACYTKTMTKRILLKLSGEQLQGEFTSGFDPRRARWIAEQIKPALETGAEIVIMVGGGNYVRGNQIIGHGIQPVSAHNIGMLSTLMNAMTPTYRPALSLLSRLINLSTTTPFAGRSATFKKAGWSSLPAVLADPS